MLFVWLLLLAAAVLAPKAGDRACRQLERSLSRVARHRAVCWIGMGLLVLFTRAALLPLEPIPKPVIYDEFGYLLQADTFASGRLTNPPHPLWPFFESIYILQQPTYNAKFPPGQGMALAAGQVLFGHAWLGVWLSAGALMAALCWALQGWLPPQWALLGAILALRLCVFSDWMNSYWGGAVAAIGGALALGAYPRIVRRHQPRFAWLLGLGLVILAVTRPFEGLLFAIPILVALGLRTRAVKTWAPLAAALAMGGALILFYNHRVTGHALLLPYVEHMRQYGYVSQFSFLPLRPEVTYRHDSIARLYYQWEFGSWSRSRTWHVFADRALDWSHNLTILCGHSIFALVLAVMLPATIRDRRMRLPLLCLSVLILGSLVEIVYFLHYAAPAAAAVMLLLVQSFRHLRHFRLRTRPVGLFLARAVPVVGLLVILGSEGVKIWRWDVIEQTRPDNARRDKLEAALIEKFPGRHVILVRYTSTRTPHVEWVYNRADIDRQEVVWAHDMGPQENRKLTAYFKDRLIWVMEPDRNPEEVTPYK
jgi:hypothetical protein